MMRVLSDEELKDVYKILNGKYDKTPHTGASTENWPTNDIIQLLKEKGLVAFIVPDLLFLTHQTELSI